MQLVSQIREHMTKTGEWGKFFPPTLSPFGYNETIANDFFPLEKEEALKRGFKWSDYEPEPPKAELPQNTQLTSDGLPAMVRMPPPPRLAA